MFRHCRGGSCDGGDDSGGSRCSCGRAIGSFDLIIFLRGEGVLGLDGVAFFDGVVFGFGARGCGFSHLFQFVVQSELRYGAVALARSSTCAR